MKTVLKLMALALMLSPFTVIGAPLELQVDYYGVPISVRCEVDEVIGAPEDFRELTEMNLREVENCADEILNQAAEHKIEGYALVLFMGRFVAGLPGEAEGRGLVSFASAVNQKLKLSRTDRVALLFSLLKLGEFGVEVKRFEDNHFLLLRVEEKLVGRTYGQRADYYVWEPGFSFEDPGPVKKFGPAYDVVYQKGRAVTFDRLPELPWPKTGAGRKVTFQSPEGCPDSWAFPVERLPRLEEYLRLWPRDTMIMANLSDQLLKPFGFEDRFKSAAPALSPLDFGNCLLQWVIVNTEYDDKHQRESKTRRLRRNPLETLMEHRSGVCGELSILLVGVLRLAGFPAGSIKVAIYNEGQPDSHLNLAVAPAEVDPGGRSFTADGVKYFVMDPAFRRRVNGKLMTGWGEMSDQYSSAQLFDLKER